MTIRNRTVDLTVLTFVALNGLAGPVWRAVANQGWVDATLGLFGISVVVWIAFGLAAIQLSQSAVSRFLVNRSALLVGVAFLIPSAQVAWAAGACWFTYRVLQDRMAGGRVQAGCLIAIALCVRTPATWLLTTLLAEPLLQFDAVLAGWLAGLAAPIAAIEGNIVINESGHRLFVMTGCSSWNNLSLALLFWFSMTQGLLPADRQPPLWHGAAIGVTVVLINIIRLSVMAQSPDMYHWLHDGFGTDLVLATTAMTVAAMTCFSLKGDRRAPLSA